MEAFDTEQFKNYSYTELKEIQQQLLRLRKAKHKEYIAPLEKQHITPLKDRYINPIKNEHIKPINDALKELNKYLPHNKYWKFEGKIYGPMTKSKMIKMIEEVSPPNTF